jgi:hypothetical protein
MLEFLEKALERTWPRECLFVKTRTRKDFASAVRVHPFLYVLADFAWTHNLRLLDSDIKRVSFDNIQSPNMDIATELHGLREDLAYLRAEVGHMIRFTPPALVRYYNESSDEDYAYRPREDPVNSSQRIADDSHSIHSSAGQSTRGYANLVGRRVRSAVLCHGHLWNEFARAERLHATGMDLS